MSTYTTEALLKALAAAPAEHVAPGFSFKWLYDRRLLYVIGDSSSRADIDAWYQFMASVIKDWPEDRIYLAVQDLSSPKFTLTPYARARASDTYKVRPALKGRVALILPKTFVGQLIRLFIHGERRNHFETRFFVTQSDALAWLAQDLPAPAVANTVS